MGIRRAATLPEGPTGDFKGDIKVDDKLPTRKELDRAGDIEVFDKDKKAYKFSDLYSNTDGDKKHTYIIIFIRHFFCGNCQEYLRTFSTLLPPSSLPSSTSVIVIGCGAPLHIAQYIANTACLYPIYADPSKKLYQALRMTRTLNLGSRSPEYMDHTSITKLALRSIWQEFRAGRQMLSGGDFWQVGGEFVFETTPSPSSSQAQDGTEKEKEKSRGETKVTWCHRMRNTRDHAEMTEIKSVLGISDAATTTTPTDPTTPAAAATTAGSDTDTSSSADDEKVPPKPMKRWSTFSGAVTSAGGLGRRMSMKVKRASWAPPKPAAAPQPPPSRTDATAVGEPERKKPASPGAKDAENERKVLEQLKEEGPADHQVDGQGQGLEGGTEDALAKLTGAVPAQPPSSSSPPVKEDQEEGEEKAGQKGAVVEEDDKAVAAQGQSVATMMTTTDEHKKREGVVLDTGAGAGAGAGAVKNSEKEEEEEEEENRQQKQQQQQEDVMDQRVEGLGTNGHAVAPAPVPVQVTVA